MKKLLLILALFLVSGSWFLVTPIDAAIPHLIRYQGTAIDKEGVPLDGPYNITFRIYDTLTGGTPLWQETQELVPVSKGTFSVLLGNITPLDLPFDKDYYLSLEINTDGEMLPCQRITSVAYAYRAEVADNVKGIPVSQTPTPNNLLPLDSTGKLPVSVIPQGSTSGLDADTVDGKEGTELLDLTKHTGKVPLISIPQGPGSGLDADTVDGAHKDSLLSRSTHTGTQAPSTVSPQGPGSGLNADQVDGFHASATPEANKLLVLDGEGKVPGRLFRVYDSGWFAVSANKSYTKTHNLGTTKLLTWFYYATDANGSGMETIAPCYWVPNYGHWGGQIQDITTTQLTIRTSYSGVNGHIPSGGGFQQFSSGYYRVIAIALE